VKSAVPYAKGLHPQTNSSSFTDTTICGFVFGRLRS